MLGLLGLPVSTEIHPLLDEPRVMALVYNLNVEQSLEFAEK